MKNHQEAHSSNDIIGHNTALKLLGISLREVYSDWLKSKWQDDLAWRPGDRKFGKGYSPALLENLSSDPELKLLLIK